MILTSDLAGFEFILSYLWDKKLVKIVFIFISFRGASRLVDFGFSFGFRGVSRLADFDF